MVYESDFYTTRRPYSSRPYVSSYSVSPLHGPFYLYNPVRTYIYVRQIPHLPYCAHRKLVSIAHSPVRIYHAGAYVPIKIHSRVRPSVIAAELNRIRYLSRPSYVSHTEKYLNSRDYIDFDDETREIRAKTDNLLRRIHVFVPRKPISDYCETTPERLRSDDYVRRIINAKHARKEIEELPWYSTPEKHRDIGAGHLACVKYTGGRPQSKRRPYFTVGDLVPGDVRSDVNMMSYYVRNRKAAEDALKKKPDDDTIKKVQEYLEKKAADKKKAQLLAYVKESIYPPYRVSYRIHNSTCLFNTLNFIKNLRRKQFFGYRLEEERRAWEAAERKRIAEEKELARLAEIKQEEDRRLAEIKENERLEAERQAILQKAEEARQEAIRLAEDEKLLNEAVAQAVADEEERLAREAQEKEEELKREEQVEKELVQSVALEEENEVSVADHHSSEEHSLHAEPDVSDQDNEEKPYEVDHDEDTQVEEIEHEEPEDELDNPFTSTGEAASSLPLDEEPVQDTLKVRIGGGAGGEQGFDWSDIENEVGDEDAHEEAQSAPVREEAPVEQHQVFENSDIESQADVVSCHEEQEVEVTQEEAVQEEMVQETQEEEEAQETMQTREDEQEDVVEEEKETRHEDEDDDQVTITEIHDEEENVQEVHPEEVKSEEEGEEEE